MSDLFLVLMAVTLSFALIFSLNNHSYAWHLHLGIDDNEAAELYKTNPNEPGIFRWKNSLQLAIDSMDYCFNIESAISCKSLIYGIMSECNLHPNELLACNDSRLADYPLILTQAEEEQEKVIRYNKCIVNTLNLTMTYEDCYRIFKGNQTK